MEGVIFGFICFASILTTFNLFFQYKKRSKDANQDKVNRLKYQFLEDLGFEKITNREGNPVWESEKFSLILGKDDIDNMPEAELHHLVLSARDGVRRDLAKTPIGVGDILRCDENFAISMQKDHRFLVVTGQDEDDYDWYCVDFRGYGYILSKYDLKRYTKVAEVGYEPFATVINDLTMLEDNAEFRDYVTEYLNNITSKE